MMRPVPPGEILQEQLEELDMSATQLASHLGVPPNRITLILKAERALTADTALRLSKFFGTTPAFWMALQSNYELRKAELEARPLAEVIPLYPSAPGRTASRGGSTRLLGLNEFGAPAKKKKAAKKALAKKAKKAPARRVKKA